MVMTVLHVLHVPLALVWGWWMGTQVRRKRVTAWEGYALALAPGALIALSAWLLQRTPGPHEQPWQGLLLWAAWGALGFLQGWKLRPRAKRLITLGLGREPE